MTTTVFLAVLFAALLHASWNALVKGGADKDVSMTAVVVGQGVLALPALLFVPAPSAESWPWLVATVVLHLGYQLFLLAAYRAGDLTEVYPIARGSAPLIVAFISVAALGVTLHVSELAGVVMIVVGIMSLSMTRRADGAMNPRAMWLALGTGCFIASYSLVDGIGARMSGTVLGYYGWAAIANAAIFLVLMSLRDRTMPRRMLAAPGPLWIGGGASYAAYALVMWAFTQAPIALVTALRETSILFALLFGVFALGERLNWQKVLSTAVTIGGVAVMRLAR